MTEIDVLVIEPGSWRAEPLRVTRDLSSFQRLVGGYIESLPLSDRLGSYINEEGKIEGLDRNDAADRFVKHMLVKDGRRMLGGDYVAGPLVLIGEPDDDGETTSVPADTADLLAEVGIKVGGDGPVVEVLWPETPSIRSSGYDGRAVKTEIETSIPNVVLSIWTGHSKERKAFSSIALGVRKLPSDGRFSSELSSPMDSLRVLTEPVPRFSQQALAATHRQALATCYMALDGNPDAFTGILLKTPHRD